MKCAQSRYSLQMCCLEWEKKSVLYTPEWVISFSQSIMIVIIPDRLTTTPPFLIIFALSPLFALNMRDRIIPDQHNQ